MAPGTFDKLTSIQTLDLRGNGINTVAPGTFDKLTSIQTLDLSFNRINTVAPGTFDKLTSIQTLDLSFNRINTVAPGTFDKLTSIQTLDLSYNWINTVAPGTFDKLTSIQTLDLSYNWINTVAPGTFDKLTSIQTLDLSHNRINTVAPGTFDKLTSIQTLDLSHNRINTVAPGTFDKLTSIQTLDLSHNRINTVAPGTFDKLTSIQTLDLSRNRIKTVAPGNFDKLTSIQTLDLHKNSPLTISGLTNIADGLRRKHLTRLDLSGVFSTPEQLKTGLSVLMNIRTLNLGLCSKFSSITSEIAFEEFRHIIIIRLTKDELFHFSELKFHGIKNLLWIDLAENKFTSFPKDLPNSLEFLNLRGNHITSDLIAQVSSAPLVSLRVLDLSDNDLEYVHHDGIFRSLKSLQVLRLEKNKLGKTVFSSKISELLFSGLTELEEINISSNNIRNLSKSVFRDQVSLKVLKINDNQLSRWDLNSFKFTKNLEKLDLSYNIITGVTEKNLHDLNYLQELNLTGNRFVCNCDLLWFREWIDNTSVVLPGKESYMCHGPDEWRGKLFLEFTKDTSNCTYTIAGSVSDNDSVSVAVIGSVCAALLISLLTVTFVYRNRWRIRLRLYLIAKLGRLFLRVMGHGQMTHDRGINEDNDQGLYDAYISCSENDHEWVLQHLLPDIDNGRLDDDNIFGGDFKFYYDPRDKDPGRSCIQKNHELVCNSKRMENLKYNLSRHMTKPTKWHVRPANTQISLGIRPVWSESSLCAQCVAKDPNFLHADSEDSDLSLRWAHMPIHWFCHDAAQIKAELFLEMTQ